MCFMTTYKCLASLIPPSGAFHHYHHHHSTMRILCIKVLDMAAQDKGRATMSPPIFPRLLLPELFHPQTIPPLPHYSAHATQICAPY